MNTQSQPIVVFGANGVQGAAAANALIASGQSIRVATQSGSTNLVLGRNDTVVKVNFDDTESLQQAFAGAAGAYFNIPVSAGPRIGEWLENILKAAGASELPRLVFEPRGSYPDFETSVPMIELNRALSTAVLGSKIPTAVIRTNIYLDNLLGPWVKPDLVQNKRLRYPLLAEQRVGWATAEDAGKLASALFLQESFKTEVVDLWTSDDPTAGDLASEIGRALGSKVQYEFVTPDEFGVALGKALGSPQVGEEIAKLYNFVVSSPRHDAQPVLSRVYDLGVKPLTLAEWVDKQIWVE